MEFWIEYQTADPSEADKVDAQRIVDRITQQLDPLNKEIEEAGVVMTLIYLNNRPCILKVDGTDELQDQIIGLIDGFESIEIWKSYRKFNDWKMAKVSDKILAILYDNTINPKGDLLDGTAYSEENLARLIGEHGNYISSAFRQMREQNKNWFVDDFVPENIPKSTNPWSIADPLERLKAHDKIFEYNRHEIRPFALLPEHVKEVKQFINDGGYFEVYNFEYKVIKTLNSLPSDKKQKIDHDFIREIKQNLIRVQALLDSEILIDKTAPVYRQSVYVELLICLRDLIFKADHIKHRLSFNNDINLKPTTEMPNPDISDLIKFFRDCVCHANNPDKIFTSNVVVEYTMYWGKGIVVDVGGLTVETLYDDDIGFIMGGQVLYYKRHILKAWGELFKTLSPLSKLNLHAP